MVDANETNPGALPRAIVANVSVSYRAMMNRVGPRVRPRLTLARGRAGAGARARGRATNANDTRAQMETARRQSRRAVPVLAGEEVRTRPRRSAKVYLPPFDIEIRSRYCSHRRYHLTKNTKAFRPCGRLRPGESLRAKRCAPGLRSDVRDCRACVALPHLARPGICSALSHLFGYDAKTSFPNRYSEAPQLAHGCEPDAMLRRYRLPTR